MFRSNCRVVWFRSLCFGHVLCTFLNGRLRLPCSSHQANAFIAGAVHCRFARACATLTSASPGLPRRKKRTLPQAALEESQAKGPKGAKTEAGGFVPSVQGEDVKQTAPATPGDLAVAMLSPSAILDRSLANPMGKDTVNNAFPTTGDTCSCRL